MNALIVGHAEIPVELKISARLAGYLHSLCEV